MNIRERERERERESGAINLLLSPHLSQGLLGHSGRRTDCRQGGAKGTKSDSASGATLFLSGPVVDGWTAAGKESGREEEGNEVKHKRLRMTKAPHRS